MKRTFMLPAAVLALVLVLAACGGDQTDATASPTEATTPAPTVAATTNPTPSPTEDETAAPTDGGGSAGGPTGDLSDLLPDRVGDLERVDLPPGMEQMFAGALGQQGLDAEDADFVWAQWGEAAELMVTGLRAPGAGEADLQALAGMLSRGMTGGEVEIDAEATTVGGKSVLRMTPVEGGMDRTVYIYVADDAMFTVVAESEDLAAELLGQLP